MSDCKINRQVEELPASGWIVYFHCNSGYHRSPQVVAGCVHHEEEVKDFKEELQLKDFFHEANCPLPAETGKHASALATLASAASGPLHGWRMETRKSPLTLTASFLPFYG